MKVLYSKKNGITNKLSGINLPVDADKINYDNTDSELQSTNVQDAIDEVVEGLDDKVDKVTGKGLSTNDYDNTDKAKVGKIDTTTTAVTGNPISITGLKSNQLAKDPIITFEPIQAGSGDPSPSNIRAISGYDKIEVLSCGKNLLNPNVYSVANAYLDGNGNVVPVSAGSFWYISEYIPVKSSVYYTITASNPLTGSSWCVYDANKTLIVAYTWTSDDMLTYSTQLSESAHYIRISYYFEGNRHYQLEEGSTATPYEPYNPLTDIQLTLGQTIYGGILDVEKGILTVDREGVDLGSLEWSYASGDSFPFTASLPNAKNYAGSSQTPDILCSYYRPTSLASISEDSIGGFTSELNAYRGKVGVKDSTYTSAQDFASAVTGQKLVYKRYTPYTIQLTPHEISLLKDYAYVSTNGTNMSFSYKNGEMASLGDVESLGKTVNLLGTETDLQIGNLSSRIPNNITSRIKNLPIAVAEQNLEKYGYKIGDYFDGTSQSSNNFRYWLADMDTFYGGYDYYVVESVHHIGIVVDTMQNFQWYTSSDITDIGYNQSTLHSYLSGSALDIIKSDMIALFGGSTGLEHLLGHMKLWNKLGTWYWSDENQYIAALTECQLAGAKIWSADNFQQGEGHKHLQIFDKYCYNQILGYKDIWLRSIRSSSDACIALRHGFVHYGGVTASCLAAGLILFH